MFLIIICVLIYLIYLYSTRNFNYWRVKGVIHDKPLPFFGTIFKIHLQKQSMSMYFTELYFKYPKEDVVGVYAANEKFLMIRNPDFIKPILIGDFGHFYARGLNKQQDAIEPMFKNLFHVDGDLWKLLRQKLTPTFTSAKLKAMFPLIVQKAEKLQKIAADEARIKSEVNVKYLMARYTTDFIGACAFGIDADSLADEDTAFRKLGKRIFELNFRDIIVKILKETMPKLFKHLHLINPEIEEGMLSLVKNIMVQRDYKPCGRNDFIDLLLELKQNGKLIGESIETQNFDGTPKQTELIFDDLLLTAQVFVFFAAGFETSSSATSYTLHQLAFNPEAQKKCQAEIDSVITKHKKLTYEAVKEMKYLEMAFKEGMRMFPPVGFLIRKCVKKYTLPTGLVIDNGVTIIIPVHSLHYDPEYFNYPNEFRPERFLPAEITDIQKKIYLPFGEGPRACIGERLGRMQSLAGLAAILHKFNVSPSKNTVRVPIKNPIGPRVVQSVLGGLPLTLTLREKTHA